MSTRRLERNSCRTSRKLSLMPPRCKRSGALRRFDDGTFGRCVVDGGSGRPLFHERLEDFHERSLLFAREPRQRVRSSGHPLQELRPESRAGWRELKHFHPAVLGRRLAPHETSGFQAVDQPGDVRCVTRQGAGEPVHGQGAPGLDQVQHVALDRREVELRARRRQVRSLRKEELHQELPGTTGIVMGLIHHDHYT
jgi:hypothetical protein